MLETIQLSATLPASPEQIYRDWLSSTGHTAFTGSPAEVDPAIGGRFTAWDGYIEGTNIELEPYRRILQAWRTSEFPTGSPAEVDPAVGGRFTAWDGYIAGTNIELEPYRRILQAWRTSEFPTGSPDSRLEVLLEAVEGGTRLTINHSHIPEGQGAMYAQGWQDFYFTPMRAYYLSL